MTRLQLLTLLTLTALFTLALTSSSSTPVQAASGDTLLLTTGMDPVGNDIDVLSNTSLNTCKTRCKNNASCKAFMYRARQKKCWLKNKLPGRIEHVYTITKYFTSRSGSNKQEGSKGGYSATDSAATMGLKFNAGQRAKLSNLNKYSRDGMDRPGADYKTYQFGSIDKKFFPLCKQLCALDAQCQAVAFNTSPGNGKCYLKRSSPNPKSKPKVLSASANPGNKA